MMGCRIVCGGPFFLFLIEKHVIADCLHVVQNSPVEQLQEGIEKLGIELCASSLGKLAPDCIRHEALAVDAV